ncbi:MAG: hypothetical protein IKY40_00885, partial [Phascolarctobacterium sp.]|nr:hypothetical protein [Phascolarctobacterium sp.]
PPQPANSMVAATMSIITTKPSFLAITKNLLKNFPVTARLYYISHCPRTLQFHYEKATQEQPYEQDVPNLQIRHISKVILP